MLTGGTTACNVKVPIVTRRLYVGCMSSCICCLGTAGLHTLSPFLRHILSISHFRPHISQRKMTSICKRKAAKTGRNFNKVFEKRHNKALENYRQGSHTRCRDMFEYIRYCGPSSLARGTWQGSLRCFISPLLPTLHQHI